MSGRFADTQATDKFVLSHQEPLTPAERKAGVKLASKPWIPDPCGCEGQPHEFDWIEVRTEVGTGDWEALPSLAGAAVLRHLAVSWNLTENGETALLDQEHFDRLFVDVFEAFDAWATKHIRWGQPLPNESGAPSRNGSRVSASRTRTTPKSG